MKNQSTAELLRMKIDDMIYDIKEADAEYWRWYCEGCHQLALLYKEKLERLFTELADINITFLKEQACDRLDRISTCAALTGIGIPYNETNGSIYI